MTEDGELKYLVDLTMRNFPLPTRLMYGLLDLLWEEAS